MQVALVLSLLLSTEAAPTRVELTRFDVLKVQSIDTHAQTFDARCLVQLRLIGCKDRRDPFVTFSDNATRSVAWFAKEIEAYNSAPDRTNRPARMEEPKITTEGDDLIIQLRFDGRFQNPTPLHAVPFYPQELRLEFLILCRLNGPIPVELTARDNAASLVGFVPTAQWWAGEVHSFVGTHDANGRPFPKFGAIVVVGTRGRYYLATTVLALVVALLLAAAARMFRDGGRGGGEAAGRSSGADSVHLRNAILSAVEHLGPPTQDQPEDRFTGQLRRLITGRAEDAAHGLRSLLGVDPAYPFPAPQQGVAAIQAEISARGTAEDRECLEYVLNRPAGSSGLTFPNSPYPRDCDAGGLRADRKAASGEGMQLADFWSHDSARVAKLEMAHVLALRLYTTAAFKSIVDPLRTGTQHPLPATVFFLSEAIGKLRAVGAKVREPGQTPDGALDLWRGLATMDRALPADFIALGGTEKAPMSCTSLLEVAVRYSASRAPMLLWLRSPNFMQRGADVSFLSAFPAEAEILFPPLTFMQVARTHVVQVPAGARPAAKYTVVEVVPVVGGP